MFIEGLKLLYPLFDVLFCLKTQSKKVTSTFIVLAAAHYSSMEPLRKNKPCIYFTVYALLNSRHGNIFHIFLKKTKWDLGCRITTSFLGVTCVMQKPDALMTGMEFILPFWQAMLYLEDSHLL